MSQVPVEIGAVLNVMRDVHEKSLAKKLAGEKRKHARVLVEELRNEGVIVNDDALNLLLKCATEVADPTDSIDLLYPDPVVSVDGVDILEVWSAIAAKNCKPALLSDIAPCFRKYRDRIKPCPLFLGDDIDRVDQLCFLVLKYKGKPWLVTLGQTFTSQYLLGAEPLVRSIVPGCMFPYRPN